MHIRSQSIDLMPEIEQNCMIDLATCKGTEVKGEVSEDHLKRIDKEFSLGNEMFTR